MKKLLLAGGGHAHVEVLRRLALERPAGVEITLVSAGRHAPYSGMLPGLIAGHYTFGECHIDLPLLAARAQARWVDANVAALDPAKRLLMLREGAALDYDVLSINSGSIPASQQVPGVVDYAIAVKPVAGFLEGWERLFARWREGQVQSIAVVGGGAAGVEVLLAMQHRMAATRVKAVPQFHLMTDSAAVMPFHGAGARRVLERNLARKGVVVHVLARVTAVSADSVTANGQRIPADGVVWVTGAAPPAWLAKCGLARNGQGFLDINHHLQSTVEPQVFAAGDCATIAGCVYPKSGVYAVRQGPLLAQNVLCALRGEPLESYAPQPRALALISTGEQHAIASWGAFSWHGNWVWRWKDRIDRALMAKYGAQSP